MKNKHALLCLMLLLAVSTSRAVAQNVSIYAGKSKTLYDSRYYPDLFGEHVAPTFYTLDVKLGWADYSSSPYASICKHPERGIGFQIDGLSSIKAANGPGMGNIYSIYGYIDRPLIVIGDFSFGYSGEFGLGFMFRHRYDPVENPWNVIISTPVNAHISLGLQAQYAISPRFDAGIGFFFNHHSNGAISFPNYGLNAFELALRLGMKTPKSEEEIHRETVDDGFKRRFCFGIQASGGIMSDISKRKASGSMSSISSTRSRPMLSTDIAAPMPLVWALTFLSRPSVTRLPKTTAGERPMIPSPTVSLSNTSFVITTSRP